MPQKKINSTIDRLRTLSRSHQDYEKKTLSLLASASYSPYSIRQFGASTLTNITTEGFPNARYHPGSRYADEIESLAVREAKATFSCSYANVQPHSASSANTAILLGLLSKNDTIMGMDLSSGGHLTHGAAASFSGKLFNSQPYFLTDGLLDYERIRVQALKIRPAAIICGASSYPRSICFKTFRDIADEVGAILIADISHISGLVIAGLHQSPINYAHIVTTSTYKQLLGPRGGLILSQLGEMKDLNHNVSEENLNQSVFPLTQGTPNIACIASKAAALSYAQTEVFTELMTRVASIARRLSEMLTGKGFTLVTKGTDTHMIVLDLRAQAITGIQSEKLLESIGVLANRNMIPNDPLPPMTTSGLRIGTNILAQRNFDDDGIKILSEILFMALIDKHIRGSESHHFELKEKVDSLCSTYPINEGCFEGCIEL